MQCALMGRSEPDPPAEGSPPMAYHLSVQPISRAKGRSAVACAAYRSGELLRDKRTGQTHDYRRKGGVLSTGLIGWQGTREELWQAAEAAERRKDARVAREIVVAIPEGLDADAMRAQVLAMVEWLHLRYGVAVDYAVHSPSRAGDQRNYHAHLMLSTRASDGHALAATKVRVLDDRKTGPEEIEAIRAYWGEHCQSMVSENERVAWDHRSFARRGLEIEPTKHVGVHATAIERRAQRKAESEGRDYKPVTERALNNAEVFDRRALQEDSKAIDDEIELREAAEKLRKQQENERRINREIERRERAAEQRKREIATGVGSREAGSRIRRGGLRRIVSAACVVAAAACRRVAQPRVGVRPAAAISFEEVGDHAHRGGRGEVQSQRRDYTADISQRAISDSAAAKGQGIVGKIVGLFGKKKPTLAERMADRKDRLDNELSALRAELAGQEQTVEIKQESQQPTQEEPKKKNKTFSAEDFGVTENKDEDEGLRL